MAADRDRAVEGAEEPDSRPCAGPGERVAGRADGGLVRIESRSGTKGAWNPELNNPAPNTTYIVDGRYTFRTDEHGRTVQMTTDALGFDPRSDTGDRRNTYQQTQVARLGGAGYEGGHGFGTKFLGPGERINLIPMLVQINRGAGPNSFARLEEQWRGLLDADPNTKIAVDISLRYDDGGNRVPRRILVKHSINAIEQRPREFFNAK